MSEPKFTRRDERTVLAQFGAAARAEEQVLELCDVVRGYPGNDNRLLAIARTQFELGFLALNKALGDRPGRVALPEDEV